VSNTNAHEDAALSIDKSLPPTPAVRSGADEKKEMMERLQPAKNAKATDAAQRKGDRWERDPTTGVDVLVKDPEFEGAWFLILSDSHTRAYITPRHTRLQAKGS
jgi:hypothetical protein